MASEVGESFSSLQPSQTGSGGKSGTLANGESEISIPVLGLQEVITSTVPIKDPSFATIKSTNYLPNALVVTEAEEQGASVGHLAEGQNMNVGVVTAMGKLRFPTFDRKQLELLPKFVENPFPKLMGKPMPPLSDAELREAAELMRDANVELPEDVKNSIQKLLLKHGGHVEERDESLFLSQENS